MKPFWMIGAASALLALPPAPAEARTEKTWSLGGAQYLPQAITWSLSDRSGLDQTKAERFSDDDGDAGWDMTIVAVRSRDPLNLAGDTEHTAFRDKHVSIGAWHSLGGGDVIRFGAMAGRTSHRADYAVILPARTHAGYAGADLSWDHGHSWSASVGYYRQGGWGGRSFESDILHLTNGEPAAAGGLHLNLRMPIAGAAGRDGESRGTWLGLDGHSGSRAAGLGQPLRHGSDLSLVLTSNF